MECGEFMKEIGDLTALLGTLALFSAVAEMLLCGRKGSEIVCLMLAMAGVCAAIGMMAGVLH